MKYLSDLKIGDKAVISGFEPARCSDQEFARDLEERLLEIGFEEGLQVEILHEGLIGRDPLAVQVGNITIALRRMEADVVRVTEISRNGSETSGEQAA